MHDNTKVSRLETAGRLFHVIGISYHMKRSARIALRRLGSMSQKRPAAGGESCEQDSFL